MSTRTSDLSSHPPAAADSQSTALHREGRQSWQIVLDVAATIAMLAVAIVILWKQSHAPNSVRPSAPVALPTRPVSLEGLPLIGAPSAKAAMLVFSDFQCPYCARFVGEVFPSLKERYVATGLIRVGFRHLPLPMHDRAKRAAESAECAAQQGQFWAMHDALFRDPLKLQDLDLSSDAAAIGLDRKQFDTCLSRPPSNRIDGDIEIARSLGFGGTPSFVIGKLDGALITATTVLVGTQPLNVFEKALTNAVGGR